MINRIILIGNGFDLANGLRTNYKSFIDDYWKSTTSKYSKEKVEDIFECDEFSAISLKTFADEQKITNYVEFFQHIANTRIQYTAKNHFFLQMCHNLYNKDWWDVESYFYNILKDVSGSKTMADEIKKLNQDFEGVKKLLEAYLFSAKLDSPVDYEIVREIKSKIFELINFDDISEAGVTQIVNNLWGTIGSYVSDPDFQGFRDQNLGDFESKIVKALSNGSYDKYSLKKFLQSQSSTLTSKLDVPITILNFNYTDTESFYINGEQEVIKIHGELNNIDNPIIFGYGDELDDSYSAIEKLNNNDFLENFKSINYSKTANYKKLLQTINSDLYQIYVMGHSCGNSDRTLLNTIFEHDNCISIKIFYHEKENGEDNYLDVYKNISRNFNNKAKLRDRVVNKKYSQSLLPLKLQKT
ncbi:AbiH family protein [Chryseobacterium balustinum]|uniref:Bacteriophage abortive infection AbiH n=1 Tax=Chryseobacterium balustinum TaxID=246 RepID=A0AAX2ILK8_9FLAO|nr:AbiH family protein [Chryseobacterium balustinum]AZB30568.1 hypothetical protein EB354_15615 [Chryseobacterium balustinum]SKB49809.1 Bacteriophage abortive infection AbiH [Chryseobacterium balustinum]SQA89014.1 Uncharacterised protein [Chryseobacterium balustinum]